MSSPFFVFFFLVFFFGGGGTIHIARGEESVSAMTIRGGGGGGGIRRRRPKRREEEACGCEIGGGVRCARREQLVGYENEDTVRFRQRRFGEDVVQQLRIGDDDERRGGGFTG